MTTDLLLKKISTPFVIQPVNYFTPPKNDTAPPKRVYGTFPNTQHNPRINKVGIPLQVEYPGLKPSGAWNIYTLSTIIDLFEIYIFRLEMASL